MDTSATATCWPTCRRTVAPLSELVTVTGPVRVGRGLGDRHEGVPAGCGPAVALRAGLAVAVAAGGPAGWPAAWVPQAVAAVVSAPTATRDKTFTQHSTRQAACPVAPAVRSARASSAAFGPLLTCYRGFDADWVSMAGYATLTNPPPCHRSRHAADNPRYGEPGGGSHRPGSHRSGARCRRPRGLRHLVPDEAGGQVISGSFLRGPAPSADPADPWIRGRGPAVTPGHECQWLRDLGTCCQEAEVVPCRMSVSAVVLAADARVR